MPEISIESLDMNFSVNNRGNSSPGSWEACDTYFNNALLRLEKSGAEIIIIASVTPHARLKERSIGVGVPIISIYDAIGSYCRTNSVSNLLVLGTMPTMTTSNFIDCVANYDINAFYPESEELKNEVTNIISNLYQNKTESAAININKLVSSCVNEKKMNNTAVCLACTELPIAFGDYSREASFNYEGVTYYNSSIIHADSAFAACI